MAYYTASSTPADEENSSNMDYSEYPTPNMDNSLPRKIQFNSPTATPSADTKQLARKSVSGTGGADVAVKYDNATIAQYMKNQLELTSNENATYTEYIETLINSLEDKSQALESVQNELKGCKEEIVHYKLEISQYMNNQLDLQSSETKDYEEKISIFSEELDRKDNEILELQSSLARKDEDNKSLVQKSLIREVDFQTRESEFNSQLSSLKSSFEEEIIKLKSGHEETVNNLNWELTDLKNEIESLNLVF